jgi:hypothetical protein
VFSWAADFGDGSSTRFHGPPISATCHRRVFMGRRFRRRVIDAFSRAADFGDGSSTRFHEPPISATGHQRVFMGRRFQFARRGAPEGNGALKARMPT